nr:FapA family protein [Desulforamulus aquiferis]
MPEDVNVKTGNIRFKGNVTILGSVENDMSVSASGDITVSNIITRCTIIAGGNVTVKGNIVNSEIISGGFFVICNTLKPPLQELGKALENLLLAGAIMYDKLPPNTNINFGNVLVLLIEKRYTNFIGLLDKIQKMFKELDMKLLGEYDHKLQKLVNNLHLIKLVQYQTPADFEATINELNSFFYYAARHEKNRSLVDVNVVLNSVIKSSGDVMVQGAGCFNTHIIAEGNVTVNGVVRGGVIEAKDDIFIKELGSEFSSKSVVITAKDKKIKITNAFEGVKVQVGKMQKVLEKKMTNIEVSLDEEGYLQIKNF